MTQPHRKIAAALRATRESVIGSYPAPDKPLHLFKPAAVESGDGNDHVTGKLLADLFDSYVGVGQVHLVGQDRVGVPHLGKLCHLVVDIADRLKDAPLPRFGRVDQVQDQVGVPHRRQGLRHRLAHLDVSVDALDQPAGVDDVKALHSLPHGKLEPDRLQATGLVGLLGGELPDRLVDGERFRPLFAAGLFKGDLEPIRPQVCRELQDKEGLSHVGLADDDAPFHLATDTSSMSASVINIRSFLEIWGRRIRRTAWRRMARSMMLRTMRALPRWGSPERSRCSSMSCKRRRAPSVRRYSRCLSIKSAIWRSSAVL